MVQRRDSENVKRCLHMNSLGGGGGGVLDKSMSPRVGDFAQKSYPRPNYPMGDSRSYT